VGQQQPLDPRHLARRRPVGEQPSRHAYGGPISYGPPPETTHGFANVVFVDGHAGPLTYAELKLNPKIGGTPTVPARADNSWCWR
jgi:prepilin-type processing-associated H-X9-DG protein